VSIPGREFITQVELITVKAVGQIVGRSIVQNQLKKLRKDSDTLSRDDYTVVSGQIVDALALFVNKQEVEAAKSQLEQLVSRSC
jgi:hypothetical protein